LFLEVDWEGYPPVFLQKSAEAIEEKGVVKYTVQKNARKRKKVASDE